jgi:hypothetical protein
VEALTRQNGVRLLGKLKKKVKTDLPYLSFYKKKPETHIFFFWPEEVRRPNVIAQARHNKRSNEIKRRYESTSAAENLTKTRKSPSRG